MGKPKTNDDQKKHGERQLGGEENQGITAVQPHLCRKNNVLLMLNKEYPKESNTHAHTHNTLTHTHTESGYPTHKLWDYIITHGLLKGFMCWMMGVQGMVGTSCYAACSIYLYCSPRSQYPLIQEYILNY